MLEHFIQDHYGLLIGAALTFVAVFLPALLDGLKTYQETRSPLSALIAFISAFLSLQRWVKTQQPPTGGLVEKEPPRGFSIPAVIFAVSGAALAFVLYSHGLELAAAGTVVVYGGLLLAAIRKRSIFIVALLLVPSLGCSWLKQHGAAAASDVAACASEAATAIVPPLVADLAEAALHGEAPQWAADLARLKAAAGNFAHCLELAALHAVLGEQAPAEQPAATIGFKPAAQSTSASAGGSNAGVRAGSLHLGHSADQKSRAAERLRAAIAQ